MSERPTNKPCPRADKLCRLTSKEKAIRDKRAQNHRNLMAIFRVHEAAVMYQMGVPRATRVRTYWDPVRFYQRLPLHLGINHDA